MTTQLLLPAFYLPNIAYFQTIYAHDMPVCIEQHEHFPKQTYRTRARIATANGVLDLIIPVVHGHKEHIPVKDIRINYEHNWQRLHWLSLQTAYRSRAYFEYYEADFARFYETQFDFLLDFHLQQLDLMLRLLKMTRAVTCSETYTASDPQSTDYRQAIHPKKDSMLLHPKPYYQVFEDKNGFLSDLSMVDLLFSQGPQSKNFL